jgi:hypothetical protein
MTNDRSYNGWSNYETWNVNLWLTNDEGTYGYWTEAAQEAWNDAEADDSFTREEVATLALADRMKAEIEESVPDLGASMFADLLNAAIGEVDWHEIAKSWLDEADKTEEAE